MRMVENFPPKTIWDPESPSDDDDDHNNQSFSTNDTSKLSASPGRKSSPRKHKHPSQMDEVELQVHLWDSYRLARIILGTPIKTHLNNKTILNSIRVVAEMKLDLIRLNKELEVSKVSKVTSGTAPAPDGSLPPLPLQDNQKMESVKVQKQELQKELQEQTRKYNVLQTEYDSLLESIQNQLISLVSRLQQKPTIEDQERQEMLSELENITLRLEEKIHKKATLEVLDQKMKKLEQRQRQLEHSQARIKYEQGTATRQQLHTLEMASIKAKHLQQVLDLSGQLDSYKAQVENQKVSLQEANVKYAELEKIAVMPHEAKAVLKAMEAIHDEESSSRDSEQVKMQVVEILQRMAIGHSHNQREKRILKSSLKVAQKREDTSEEELAHLKLQQELLEGETQIPPADWREKLVVQRGAYKRQISQIMTREEQRLMEMELLEVRLTELAYLAVEIEDLQKSLKENQKLFSKEVTKAEMAQESTHETLTRLHSQVQNIIEKQRLSLEQLSRSSSTRTNDVTNLNAKLNDISRLHKLEEELARRDDELHKTKEELHQSQQRVQQLEKYGMPSYEK